MARQKNHKNTCQLQAWHAYRSTFCHFRESAFMGIVLTTLTKHLKNTLFHLVHCCHVLCTFGHTSRKCAVPDKLAMTLKYLMKYFCVHELCNVHWLTALLHYWRKHDTSSLFSSPLRTNSLLSRPPAPEEFVTHLLIIMLQRNHNPSWSLPNGLNKLVVGVYQDIFM